MLKVILIFIIVYYVFKLAMRLLAPYLAKKMMDKAAQNFENQFNNPYYRDKPAAKEGETIIEKKPEEKTSISKENEGDYVDYEEID